MCVDISVIIPMYKGEKYVAKILKQISAANEKYDGKIELILVNDDPDSKLQCQKEQLRYEVIMLETMVNTGIQSARLRGLAVANGNFIHFLDQDDEINPEYYKSQMDHIANADAVYCRCYNGNRQTYNYDRVFETAFDKEHILSVCPVISPGQVLIRKSSIPKLWYENLLINTASDDYLLWLYMYGQGCSFVPNQRLLYRHVRNGDNYSSDILRNKKSDEEMVSLLLDSGLFTEADCNELKLLPERQMRRRYIPQRKDQIVLQVLSDLLSCYEKGYTLEKYFIGKGINRVAIYGSAVLGERIKGMLKGSSVFVECFIDKNAPFVEEDIPVFKLEECNADFDAIIISLIENEDLVASYIKRSRDVNVYKIREVVREMMDGES